jgi:hypothetical protein
MIRINVLRSLGGQRSYDAMIAAVAKFADEREIKSFSDRNPELGKMINCYVCGNRHRAARVCVPVYAKHKTETAQAEDGSIVPAPIMAAQNTRKGFYGAQKFKRQQILRHRNQWGLQVLERATKHYRAEMSFYPSITVDKEDATSEEKKSNQEFRDKIGKQSLSRALNELRAARAQRRRTLFLITRESRRINRAA